MKKRGQIEHRIQVRKFRKGKKEWKEKTIKKTRRQMKTKSRRDRKGQKSKA